MGGRRLIENIMTACKKSGDSQGLEGAEIGCVEEGVKVVPRVRGGGAG